MSPEKDNEFQSLLHFNWVDFVFSNDSNTCILRRVVIKLPSENPLKETISSLPSGIKYWCFPVWGSNPVSTFHFQRQHPDLTRTFVCLCVLLQFLSVHVLINILVLLESTITSGPSIFLPLLLTSSLKFEGRFSWSFPIGTEYY